MSREPVRTDGAAHQPPRVAARRRLPGARSVLYGPSGLRAGWRLLIFAAFSLFCFQALLRGARYPLEWFHVNTEHPPNLGWTWELLLVESLLLMTALAGTTMMAKIEGRSVSDYWIPWNARSVRRLGEGILWGLLSVSMLILLIYLAGGYSFGHMALSRRSLLAHFGLWMVTALVNGFAENLLFIAYPLFTLTTGMGFRRAAIFLSLIFALAHGANSGENIVGLVSLLLQFLFFVLTIYRTGDLWLSVGAHAGGVFAENFLFSAPDSGVAYSGHLSNSSFHGQGWLTGGTVGPEGSVMAFVVFTLAIVLFNMIHRGKRI